MSYINDRLITSIKSLTKYTVNVCKFYLKKLFKITKTTERSGECRDTDETSMDTKKFILFCSLST